MRGSASNEAPSRVISASPRVISAALALSPKPRPSETPAARRDHVLRGAAQLHADQVGVRVDPQAGGRRPSPAGAAASADRLRGDDGRGRACRAAISSAWFGPDSTATRAGSPSTLDRDLRQPPPGGGIEPLRERQHVGRRPGTLERPQHRARRRRDGTAEHDQAGVRRDARGERADPQAVGDAHARQVLRVLARRLDLGRVRGVAAPAGRRRGRARPGGWRRPCPTSLRRRPRCAPAEFYQARPPAGQTSKIALDGTTRS